MNTYEHYLTDEVEIVAKARINQWVKEAQMYHLAQLARGEHTNRISVVLKRLRNLFRLPSFKLEKSTQPDQTFQHKSI